MSVKVKYPLVVKDACVFFDLMDLGILDSFYQLEHTVITTPQVLGEIDDGAQLQEVLGYIDAGKLKLDSDGDLEQLLAITDGAPALSLSDASVLDAASRRNAMILSSDKSLRNEAEVRGVGVHGMLWILEQLHVQGVLTVDVVVEKLKQYPTVNGWAPKKETTLLINKLMNHIG